MAGVTTVSVAGSSEHAGQNSCPPARTTLFNRVTAVRFPGFQRVFRTFRDLGCGRTRLCVSGLPAILGLGVLDIQAHTPEYLCNHMLLERQFAMPQIKANY
jgi:hypothetical protein